MNEKLKQAKELLEVQGQKGNWNMDDYMCGMYNGMELIIAVMEDREPVYKTLKGKHKLIEFDWLITNGFPVYDKSFTERYEKGWKVAATFPANVIHPKAMPTDMVTIFTKYAPYPKDENEIPEATK